MSETEGEDDDDDEEMPEETGNRSYDTSERDGRYEPIRTNPEEDVIQIHTDGEIPQGANIENKTRRSNGNTNKPNRYHTLEIYGDKRYLTCYRSELEYPKGNTTTDNET